VNVSFENKNKEYCADEIHLATMGLSDNHNAIVDILCTADDHLLEQIVVFYGNLEENGGGNSHTFVSGIKFGDGKYEVKSADGKVSRRFFFFLWFSEFWFVEG
jgi:hypothetical protein